MSPAEELGALTGALVRNLPGWCERGKVSTSFLSRALMAADFRSRRIVARGAERGEPRPFTLEDEPGNIDMGRLPAAAAVDFVGAAISGKLRVTPSIKTIESEFILVIDLSRSLLVGFISPHQEDHAHERAGKVNALFFAVAAFFHQAAGMGFRMRVVHSAGKRTVQERGGPPRALMLSTLSRMRDVLLSSRDRAEADPDAVQQFNLRTALEVPITVRTRGVALVVSDFLDPFPSYRSALHTLARRHHLILADVAAETDRNHPIPGFWDVEMRRKLVREGARHIEQNTRPRVNDAEYVERWNSERQRDRQMLTAATRASGATYRELAKAVGKGGEAGFLRCYRIAFGHLRQLM